MYRLLAEAENGDRDPGSNRIGDLLWCSNESCPNFGLMLDPTTLKPST